MSIRKGGEMGSVPLDPSQSRGANTNEINKNNNNRGGKYLHCGSINLAVKNI